MVEASSRSRSGAVTTPRQQGWESCSGHRKPVGLPPRAGLPRPSMLDPVAVRFYVDPDTGEPHLHRHGVTEAEALEVLGTPAEDRPGAEGARIAIGPTSSGRVLR